MEESHLRWRSSGVRPSKRLGNTTLRLACIVVFISGSMGMYLCANWLCKLFPQSLLCLTFNLRQTPSTVSGKEKKVDDA